MKTNGRIDLNHKTEDMTKLDYSWVDCLYCNRLTLLLMFFLMLLLFSACVPDEKPEEQAYLPYDLRSETFRNIYDLGDRAETDSLILYFESDEPMIRFAAVRAFSSIRDSSERVISQIALLLNDPHIEVSSMAAYALGQTAALAAEDHLVNAFRSGDTLGIYNLLNSRILEAVGKCGSSHSLELLAGITTYRPRDTLLLEGQSRGLYRFALRGMTNPEGTRTMVEYATRTNYPPSVRLIAANYLARAPGIDLSHYAYSLNRLIENESDANLRMAVALAVAKTGSARGRDLLMRVALTDSDYRVRANAIRSLDAIGGEAVEEFALEAISDEHPAVSELAARLLLRHASEDMATRIGDIAADAALPHRTRAILFAAALKNLPFYYTVTASSLNSDLRFLLGNEEDPAKREVIIFALSQDPVNLEILSRIVEEDPSPFMRVNTLLHLENTLRISRTKPATNFNRNAVLRSVSSLLISALSSGEPGKIAIASGIIQRNTEILRSQFREVSFFEDILANFDLPIETTQYNGVLAARNALFPPEKEQIAMEWNNPIDWDLFLRLPDTVRVAILFEKGEVRIALPKQVHPGTVTNLVSLVLEGFYDDNFIHRVVPNFVIQGGCPVGDGYGGPDRTIRSELPPVYFDRAGQLGMASSGNHTESSQWFITHSPAMHLDGNYTNFGQVYQGMNVVHEIEPGEKINRIILLNE
ncbi:MAG: hypothetical protein EA409_12145 [Saprospirales bacterium]|nr:MAG: hypothetical protein EA409_12145 [Saprospirales bacterium]